MKKVFIGIVAAIFFTVFAVVAGLFYLYLFITA